MSVIIRGLSCHYGQRPALDSISLEVATGELLVLLGPSGSGKTTLLSLLAGILTPSAGEIEIDGRVLSTPERVTPPENRQIGFVFQDFALWPHMTVADTVGFPLRMRRIPREERQSRVRDVLALVHLEEYGDRYPHELSGGQRQRVAMARALAPRPQLVLLDEPMSNLDAKLRERMRGELAEVLRHEGVTAIYVTHDRMEALALADRIAIIDAGRLVQVAAPDTIYREPATVFAAGFVGPVALLPARQVTRGVGGAVLIETADGTRMVVPSRPDGPQYQDGTWVVRPESLQIKSTREAEDTRPVLHGYVRACTYAGSHWQWEVMLSDGVLVTCYHRDRAEPGQETWIAVDAARTWFVGDHRPGPDHERPALTVVPPRPARVGRLTAPSGRSR